jgi:hypothetical protein
MFFISTGKKTEQWHQSILTFLFRNQLHAGAEMTSINVNVLAGQGILTDEYRTMMEY